MANGTDSEEFVLLSRVRAGHKREFAFALKAQSEICGSLGRTRSRKTRNEVLQTYTRKKLKRSEPKEAKNDAASDMKKAKDSEDLGGSMSEEEAKSDVVDLVSDDEPKSLVGESESVAERGSKDDTSLPVPEEELRSGVVEMAACSGKEEEELKDDTCAAELMREKERNDNQEKTSETGIDKAKEDSGKDKWNEAVLINEDQKAGAIALEKPLRRFTRSALKPRAEEKYAVKKGVEDSGKKVCTNSHERVGITPITTPPPSIEMMKLFKQKKFPYKLKDLLETGILEGMPVTYIRGAKVCNSNISCWYHFP